MTTNLPTPVRRDLPLVVFVLAGAAALGISTWLAVTGGSGLFVLDTADVQYLVFGAMCVGATFLAARRSTGASRTVWKLVTLAVGLNFVGDVGFVVLDALGETPWVSVLDFCYLLSYPILMAALWVLARSRNSEEGPPAMLDGLALAASLGLLAWEWVIVAPGGMAQAPGLLARLVLVAYPWLDLLLLGAVVGVLLVPGRRHRSLWSLAAFVVLYLVTDSAYTVYSFTDESRLLWIDLGFVAAYFALGYAALGHGATRIAEHQPARPPRLGRFVLLAAAAIAPGFLAAVTLAITGGVNPWIFAFSSLAVAAVLCYRMAGLMRTEHSARSAAEAMQVQLDRKAHEDELTGLPNRQALLETIGGFAPDSTVTLLLIDLDRFKAVNDTAGHQVGDVVLRDAAERIRGAVRSQDVVHRLGGDEFVVLCPDLDDAGGAEAIAARVLDAMAPVFRVGTMEWFVGASVGIATSPGGELVEADQLVHASDIAMYVAKRDPLRKLATFDLSMKRHLHDLHETELSLRRAMEEDRIEAAFQPILRLADHAVVGFETLARWRMEDGTIVAAKDFIALAEQAGLIDEIDRRMLERAARFAKAHNERHLDRAPVFVTVNLSPHYLASDVVGMVSSIVDRVGVDVTSMVVELTEGALAIDPDVAIRRLTAVRDLGVRLAIDDFGTGYSSLAQLLRFPVDFVKVDKAFVEALGRTGNRGSGAAAALGVAETLGIRAIAEGVETSEEAQALIDLGYTCAQGNLLGRPMSETEAHRLEMTPRPEASRGSRPD